MIPSQKQLVTNEAMEPVAVIIPYDDWQKIEALLNGRQQEREQQNGNEAARLEAEILDRLKELSIADWKQVLQFLDALAIEARKRAIPPEERRKRLADLARKIAERGTAFADVDPVEWQREQRKDRPLPGREEGC